jgi:hypothetical protein
MILCSTLFLFSCSKDGSNGVDGTNGTNGTIGTNGTNGANGKTVLTKTTKEAAGANCKNGGTKIETGIDANNNGTLDGNEVTTTQTTYVCNAASAIYSSWIDVNVTDKLTFLPEEPHFNYKQLLPAEALTADIVNNGLIFMYHKNKNGVITAMKKEGYITDFTVDGSSFSVYMGYRFKEKYLSLLTLSYIHTKDYINDNGSAVRYVLVPGAVQGRSMTDLQKMPYSEIAKLYNIKD